MPKDIQGPDETGIQTVEDRMVSKRNPPKSVTVLWVLTYSFLGRAH